jgi:fanconi-associated nuclease 1
VCTIFGLLFMDIIFAPIPGALETPYQSAPLDIAESFYSARQDLIESRLDDILAGRAREILEDVDSKHREKGTCCVGVRWDLFSRQDLVEIVDVSGHAP